MQHPYASFVHLVQKPARYLGGEYGARPKPWEGVQARVCLAFPDVYDIGMSHLGYKILYKILNDHPRTLAERCYAPWVDMQAELRARELPLVSLESARPLRDFDVVGFSLQFELTYTNILTMLELGGIPLRSEQRGEDDPLVVAGGPTATHPEPLAMFIDAVLIGDGEERTSEVALLWTELKSQGLPRTERLRRLAGLRGVYVPSLYATAVDDASSLAVVQKPADASLPFPVQRSLVEDLNAFPFPDDGPIGGPEAIFDRMSIEIARGCTEGCRFCQAGMIYRPVRERDPQAVVDTVVASIKKSGYDEASLTSLSTADYSCIAPLIEKVTAKLAPERVALGVSSLRAYGLSEDVLDDMQRVRAAGLTFAPEAGSQRMRDVVNKNVTEEQLLTTAERVFNRGWSTMKLYFMIGLPTEEEEDVREIVRVGARAREVGKRVKKEKGSGPPTVTVSVSTHVPKPHTPFQWCAMDPPDLVRKKQGWLRDEARTSAKIELRMHDTDGSWLEGVFARGDRRLGPVLERAYRAGARFDSWEEHLDVGLWRRAFEEEGVDPAPYLATLPVHGRLPWDHVDVGLEEGFLEREYKKALKSRLSPPCGKVAGAFVQATNLADAQRETAKLVCYDCGVACDLGAMREERLVQLRTLGALEPRRAPASGETPAPAPRFAGKKTPTRIEQGAARRYRFLYTKLGPSAYLSHLDLIRTLPRAFRRNAIGMFYSSGFHPKPDMVFGPALSLGVASLAEVVDLKLTADIDAAAWLEELSVACPDGLRFTGGVRLEANDPAVSKIIDGASYVAAVPRRALDAHARLQGSEGEPWLQERARLLEDQSEAVVLRRIDGVGKKVNVKAFLTRLEVGSAAAHEALTRAGLVGDLVPVLADISVLGSGSTKISEVLEALVGQPFEHRAVRLAVGARGPSGILSPLDLEALRHLHMRSAVPVAPDLLLNVPETNGHAHLVETP